MKTEIIKGFKDYSGEDAGKRAEIKKILVDTFEKYGFEPAETPIIEYEEFVKGENKADEVISDIYKLKDKGKRNLSLRYEFTFQLKRLIKNKKLPYRRYQIGEVFRDEPVSKNRFRQFVQCDMDIIGSTIKDEAEILTITKEILDKLDINFIIYFNNRKLLNGILDEQKIKKKQEVIREIDKLDKLPEKQIINNLKKLGADKVLAIFKKPESYFRKYNAYLEIEELKKYCKFFGVEIKFQPNLARGLSYYNGTIFEIKTSRSKESICAGGSYIVNEKQATGISFGLDRLEVLTKIRPKMKKVIVLSINQDREAIRIAKKLREGGDSVVLFYGKPSKTLEFANAKNVDRVIFVGKDEVQKGRFKVKDMKRGEEIFERL